MLETSFNSTSSLTYRTLVKKTYNEHNTPLPIIFWNFAKYLKNRRLSNRSCTEKLNNYSENQYSRLLSLSDIIFKKKLFSGIKYYFPEHLFPPIPSMTLRECLNHSEVLKIRSIIVSDKIFL